MTQFSYSGSSRLVLAPAVVASPATLAGVKPATVLRREEILTVARDLFFLRGFDAASMRDIARGINLTQAAIYYHFKSKEEILFALIDAFTVLLHDRLQQALLETDEPIEGLRRAVRVHILLTRTHFREIKLVVEDKKLLGSAYAERVKESELRIYALYRSRVGELMAAGVCRPLEPSVVVFNILAVINFIFQWYRPDGTLELEEIAKQTVELLFSGLLADAPSVAIKRGSKASRQSKS